MVISRTLHESRADTTHDEGLANDSDEDEDPPADPAPKPKQHDEQREGEEHLERTKEAVPILSPEEAQKEADSWVQEGICNMMLQAAEEAEKAAEKGDSRSAAQWDLRRAAANLVLETIR